MNSEEILKLKQLMDEGIITQEEFEKEKKKFLSPEKSKKKNTGLIICIILVIFFCIGIISNTGNNSNTETKESEQKTIQTPEIPEEFSDKFPLLVRGNMYDNIIGMPELSLSITNQADMDIEAIQIYFAPKDVYGEEVNGIFATNNLYTDNTLTAGATTTKTWQMLDQSIKSGTVYIYSIYYADGTEWGNKDAPVSDIKKYGYTLDVTY